MITITLGTIPFPFNRAANWIYELLQFGIITEPVFIQYGSSDISRLSNHPLVTAIGKMPYPDLVKMTQRSRLVISHAGQGSTRDLSARGIRFVLLPRLAKYREHVDNHQLLFAESVLPERHYYCLSRDELAAAIQSPPPALRSPLLTGPCLSKHLLSVYPPVGLIQISPPPEECFS